MTILKDTIVHINMQDVFFSRKKQRLRIETDRDANRAEVERDTTGCAWLGGRASTAAAAAALGARRRGAGWTWSCAAKEGGCAVLCKVSRFNQPRSTTASVCRRKKKKAERARVCEGGGGGANAKQHKLPFKR